MHHNRQRSNSGPRAPQRHRPKPEWQARDIAFLRSSVSYTQKEFNEVIKSGDVPEKATGHPVVVLKRLAGCTHVLVSTVSAFSSGPENNYLAPWKQSCHRAKRPHDFRSFVGSERANNQRPALQLQDGKRMPKPKASWMHIQSVFVVPLNLLGWFDKSPDLLRLTPASLADLRCHIMAECRCAKKVMDDPRAGGKPMAQAPKPAVQAAKPVARAPQLPKISPAAPITSCARVNSVLSTSTRRNPAGHGSFAQIAQRVV